MLILVRLKARETDILRQKLCQRKLPLICMGRLINLANAIMGIKLGVKECAQCTHVVGDLHLDTRRTGVGGAQTLNTHSGERETQQQQRQRQQLRQGLGRRPRVVGRVPRVCDGQTLLLLQGILDVSHTTVQFGFRCDFLLFLSFSFSLLFSLTLLSPLHSPNPSHVRFFHHVIFLPFFLLLIDLISILCMIAGYGERERERSSFGPD